MLNKGWASGLVVDLADMGYLVENEQSTLIQPPSAVPILIADESDPWNTMQSDIEGVRLSNKLTNGITTGHCDSLLTK